MAFTESTMLALGTKAPNFNLPDTVSGKVLSLDDVASDVATVVMFLCNHCPFVHFVNPEIVRLVSDYKSKGVSFIGISSNDVDRYPDDSPEKMTVFARESGYDFPYLYDSTQEVGKVYDAACTPDFYIFDGGQNLQYRGRIDDARPSNGIPLSGKDMRRALDAILNGSEVPSEQYPSGGCGIKWK